MEVGNREGVVGWPVDLERLLSFRPETDGGRQKRGTCNDAGRFDEITPGDAHDH
jgi:hypothetical protein